MGRVAFLLPALLLALLASGLNCGGAQKPPCEPVASIEARWTRESIQLIDSGECAQYNRVEDCPAFRELQLIHSLRQAKAEAECSK